MKYELTAEQLRAWFEYDSENGLFTRKVARCAVHRNKIEGRITSHGYVIICIKKRKYYAHRLAWLFVYGEWPKDCLDHINHDRTDNRIANLREATKYQNAENRIKPSKRNLTGIIGVNTLKWKNDKFISRITVKGKSLHLGTFDTKEKAHQAYLNAKRVYHDFCTL